jgi:hypothetical protein
MKEAEAKVDALQGADGVRARIARSRKAPTGVVGLLPHTGNRLSFRQASRLCGGIRRAAQNALSGIPIN